MRRVKWIRWFGLSFATLSAVQLGGCNIQDWIDLGVNLIWYQWLFSFLNGGSA
ncbi:MAG: hypothetical protein JXQ75_23795 [Phycisphaerae bacterium]|nr:hypothetical protein [Phycisphaerae bacterium]